MHRDPRALSDLELSAARYTPMGLLALDPGQRDRLARVYPGNLLYPTGGPAVASAVVNDVVLPGGVTVPLPGPDVNLDAAAGVAQGVADKITGAVLGPISEAIFGAILAGAGGLLVVLALKHMADKSGHTDAAKDSAKQAATAVATGGGSAAAGAATKGAAAGGSGGGGLGGIPKRKK